MDSELSEASLNNFLEGLKIDRVRLFPDDNGMQIWLEGGTMMTIYARPGAGGLQIRLLGPSKMSLADGWDAARETEEWVER